MKKFDLPSDYHSLNIYISLPFAAKHRQPFFFCYICSEKQEPFFLQLDSTYNLWMLFKGIFVVMYIAAKFF